MAKDLEKYDKLVIVILIITILTLGIGYFFANQKSAPTYRSKIDRLMFDKNNKSPKYVLTLPESIQTSSSTQLEEKVINSQTHSSNEKKEFSFEDLINNIPSINKLPSKTFPIELKNITILHNITEYTQENLALPKIDEQGHKPWVEYGYTTQILPNFKKIAIVVNNLGFDYNATDKISSVFNPEISLSFHPYGKQTNTHINIARQKGHETYMDIFLASKNYLQEDTGPLAINFNLENEEILNRFYKTISPNAPFGGVIIKDGLIKEKHIDKIKFLLEEIKKRGLLMIDATSSSIIDSIKIDGLGRHKADIIIHKDMSADSIDEQIKKAETLAFNKGQVLIVSDNKPLILTKIHQWINTFSPQLSYEEAKSIEIKKPFALVPISNIVVE